MAHFAINATEDAMLEIARQMRINNNMMLIEKLHDAGDIDTPEYIKLLNELFKYANE